MTPVSAGVRDLPKLSPGCSPHRKFRYCQDTASHPARRFSLAIETVPSPSPFGHRSRHKFSFPSSATEPCQGVGAYGAQVL